MLHTHRRQRTIGRYFVASSVDEGVAYLMAHHGSSLVVGGGTLVLPKLQRDRSPDLCLADVSRVASMRRIDTDGDSLIIGGAVTFARLLAKDTIAQMAPLLSQAAEQMGTLGIRQLATVAGNLVSAEGHAQGSMALMALDADVEITNSTGPQWLPIKGLFVRSGVSRVDATSEIVTGLRIPVRVPGQGMAMASLAPLEGARRSPLVCAVNLQAREPGATIAWATFIIGSVTHSPVALADVAEAVAEKALDDDDAAAIGQLVVRYAQEHKLLGNAADERYAQIQPLVADVLLRARAMAHTPDVPTP